MAARSKPVTDRAYRYRAQKNVTGPRKCVLCGATGRLDVMHLDGFEENNEKANLAYGCRRCNGALGAAFKRIGAGRPTNQYNPAEDRVPTFEQYSWGVAHHTRKAHDEGGAIIHATPKHKRVEYARRILNLKKERDTLYRVPEWARNPGQRVSAEARYNQTSKKWRIVERYADGSMRRLKGAYKTREEAERKIRGNPGKGAFERCVESVESKGRAYSPRGVCATAGRAKYGEKKFAAMAKAGKRRAARGNPADASAKVFEEFHGYEPTEIITVRQERHHHEFLSAAGEFVGLQVKPIRGGKIRRLQFGGEAYLAYNEEKNQLFVLGGDQSLNEKQLRLFVGSGQLHEIEDLGKVIGIGYFTNKTHLDAKDGGEAVYSHIFRTTNVDGVHKTITIARYPTLIYRARDEQMEIAGGSYTIRAEGIDK